MENEGTIGKDGSIIISEEMSKRIDRTKLNDNTRSAIGKFVAHDSKFAPDNAKEIVDAIEKSNPDPQNGDNMYLVGGSGKRKYFNHQVENGEGKLIDI